ncbi:uncharacterized protein J7T55_000200 [Diaporthe amygdali]|uniref:uncharacterized protein n=1 Tax=Phomopsis amygdali TaxID=1214568 RepID=UPI0022FE983F|nr:uncharacterized protein J7T55_000200 [Diaporthe amygdali]KAJ0108235.1 uncharacterized protein J7T55_000200 [Diaporthe amygdali]
MSPPCSLCNNLGKRSPHDNRLALDFTYEMLSRNGETGACKSCALMLEAIERFVSSPARAISRVYVYGLAANCNTLSVEIYFKDGRPKLILELFHHLDDSEASSHPWPAIRAKPVTKGHPLEQSSLAWVKALLQDCVERQDAQNPRWTLPKRVLKLDQGAYPDISVCLQENDTSIKGSYATLSHCWGLHQPCITTIANICKRKDGIPWTEIPQTFKDAIQYCLELGIHYLWIDALCIVQNSDEDWQRESAKMGEIFQHSLLTIAATSSPNSTTGCFADYHKAGQGKKFVLENGSRNFPPVMVRPAHRHWTLPSTSASQPYWPLLSRGWVFQEILLSPRVIHVGKTELIWESATQTQCECGASITGLKQDTRLDDGNTTMDRLKLVPDDWKEAIPRLSFRRRLQMRWKRLTRAVRGRSTPSTDSRGSAPSPAAFPEQLVWDASPEWQNIIEQYSALNLTKASDRLPALSGLAQRSASVLDDSDGSSGPMYLAGLWKKTLERDLLWRVDRLSPSSNALSTYRAPSWSWASVCTNVQYWGVTDLVRLVFPPDYRSSSLVGSRDVDKRGENLEIIRCNVKVAGQNPFGEVEGGKLVLSGHLAEAKVLFVSRRVGDGQEFHYEHDPLRYEVQISHPKVGSVQLPFYADYILSVEGTGHVDDGGVVFLLQVFVNLCFVLRPTGRVKEFHRIGLFRAPPAYFHLYGVSLIPHNPPEQITII